ncbi:Sister chromatid cohesion PDS5 B-B [Gossypium arboreum]|uniref:Sister chromatid cohesion PDS5 B-B n=1 Tax=Gossypium arboreum TaxID=29729 RepID=A0A0B0NY83_GOSAR|nr:Sister chromatid cohesion PDS5 B-B [Gossypium arboreum]
MAPSDKELELLLMEAGNKLLEPPSSVDELITLLDQVESFLSRVEQSPSQSMQNALSASLKALIAEQLFRHPDDDVKVAVAACISEITRITAPDAPYHDDQMKEVFQLIVSSFKNLSDKSNRSYIKRTSILETVAKVRSCVVMLDLECNALIIEMFQRFLNGIRDYHAHTVFASMVTIMTLVLEESEDISIELLSPILASVKRDNEEVLPIARRLGKSVLENCASKLRPYLTQAVENSGNSFEDYSSVVASICQVAPSAVAQNDAATNKPVDDKSKSAEAPLDNAEDKEIPKESDLTEQVDLANEKSPKSVVSNAIVQTDENNSLASLKKQEEDHLANKSENANTSTVAEPDELEGEKVVNLDSKLEQSTKEKGRKFHSKSAKPSDSTHVGGREVETLTDYKDDSKDDAHPPKSKRETDVQPSLTKVTKDESNDVAFPTPSGTVHDESHLKKAALPKRKDCLSKEITPVEDVSKESSEVASDSKAKTNKRPGKKVSFAVSEASAPADVDKTKKESGTASEAKSLKSFSRKLGDKTRQAQGKVIPEDGTKISTRNDDEEMVGSPMAVKPNKHDSQMDETPKTNSKRKHTASKDKASGTLEYDENLVGLKVKVWWPKDREFYEGVIHSFDPIKRKHKVCYDDGDEEILNLKREKWAVIYDETASEKEDGADRPSPDGLSEMSQKKKAKAADQPSKKAKMDALPKRGGGASSGKSKGAVTKSGQKTKEDGKEDSSKSVAKSENVTKAKQHTPKNGSRSVDGASKVGNKSKNEDTGDTPKSTKSKDDVASKIGNKSKNEDTGDTPKSTKSKEDVTSKVGNKSKNEDTGDTPKSTKSKEDVTSKVGNKSKNEDTGDTAKSTKSKDDDNVTPKASLSNQDNLKTTESKQEAPKVSSNPKDKPLKNDGKPDTNGTGKLKSGSSKVKEGESIKESSPDSAEVVETAKRKTPSSSKGQGNDPKPAKKLRDEPKATSPEPS